jgi:hypothetical protein
MREVKIPAEKQHGLEERLSVHSDALELMHRYFEALDSRDFEMVGKCFTLEANLIFAPSIPDLLTNSAHPIVGREAICETARGVSRFVATTHVLASLTVSQSGNIWLSRTRCVVYALPRGSQTSSVILRGILYTDRLVPDEGSGILIEERFHSLQWVADNHS